MRLRLMRLLLLWLCVPLTVAAHSERAVRSVAPMRLGAAWYPEQWPESRWDADLTLMEQAHINVVRIGEFAWSALEPAEGRYDLDWMSRAIALAARHHIAVVIGTPTDAPPAWLTTKYPDTLGTNADGRVREHGSRRQFNYASPRYRELCTGIVTQLALRFGNNANVIGWQIGNEYTDESFDAATRAQFQLFLRHRYHTLDNLNRRWTTAYWSQTYDRWDEIPMENSGGNPGLLLDHKRFVTATWRSFQRTQMDALRAHTMPSQFITTNIGGLAWSDNWDHYRIAADLTFASWDDYVGQGHLQVARNAMLNDFARGWRRQNFWIMETEPGSVNWASVNNALSPGETRALAWQAVGHGAEAVLYWQWRAALNGQEQYHGAVVGVDGTPLPIYPELQQLGADFGATSAALGGTMPHAEIALLHDYDSRWAIDFQPHTQLYDQQQVLLRFYKPLERIAQGSGHAIDIVDPTVAPLAGYKLLVAPSLNVMSAALAAKLVAYVRGGGHLLLGPRSGMKSEDNALNPALQPGPLAMALGAHVAQFYALEPNATVPLVEGAQAHAAAGSADIWAEPLTVTAPGTHVDLRYGRTVGGWLDDQPAMVTRALGAGTISYLGTLPDATLMSTLLLHAAVQAHVRSEDALVAEPLPAEVEVCTRSAVGAGGERSVYIVINHGDAPTHIVLKGHLRSLLPQIAITTATSSTQLDLPSQGVAVLTSEIQP